MGGRGCAIEESCPFVHVSAALMLAAWRPDVNGRLGQRRLGPHHGTGSRTCATTTRAVREPVPPRECSENSGFVADCLGGVGQFIINHLFRGRWVSREMGRRDGVGRADSVLPGATEQR